MSIAFLCPNCATRVEVAAYTRKKVRCSGCGAMCEVPAESEPAAANKMDRAPSIDAHSISPASATPLSAIAAGSAPQRAPTTRDADDAEDADSVDERYTAEPPQPRCPRCELLLAADADVCLACGFKLHPEPVAFKRVEKSWHSGWSLQTRARVLAMASLLGLGLGALGAYLESDLTLILGPWLLLNGLLAFVLGTFYRVDVKQNKRGKVWLTRTWRVCFVERPPVRIYLKDYEGIVTGMGTEADAYAWILLFLLLPFGLLPGFLWWYYVIHTDTYYAALSNRHGGVDLVLYRGMNERQAEDIAATVAEVATLPRLT